MKKRVRPAPRFVQLKKMFRYNMGCIRQEKHKLPKIKRRNNLLGGDDDDSRLVDRISQLPDEVVVSILSLLPLKEAVATSILARRWQHLWRSTVTLNFDSEFDVNPLGYYSLRPEVRDQRRLRYIDWVNRVVDQHTGSSIQRFRVCFDIDSLFTSSIDKWIYSAMKRRVQILELHFYQHISRSSERYYTFLPKELLSLEKGGFASQLQLSDHPEITSLRPCRHTFGFQFLKVLSLRYVSVTGEILEYFLSNCRLLERLSVFGASRSLDNLRVVGPSIALKHLSLRWCASLSRIEIRDTNLFSFTYHGLATNLLLNSVPSLVEVSISEAPPNLYYEYSDEYHQCFCSLSIELPLTQLSGCLSQLDILDMDIGGAAYHENFTFPPLPNLKHLKLNIKADYYRDLYLLTSFMRACPYLQTLMLKVVNECIEEREKPIQEIGNCPHYNLKVVEIVGYRALPCIIQHVMFLIMSIVGLEKIIIDPVERPDVPVWHTEKVFLNEEEEARDNAMRHLKEKVPSTIEFVCL